VEPCILIIFEYDWEKVGAHVKKECSGRVYERHTDMLLWKYKKIQEKRRKKVMPK